MIFVCAYGHGKARYAFDPLTGQYRQELCLTEKDAQQNARGFGTVRRVGLIHGKRIFVALYTENDLLKLYVDGGNYELIEEDVRVQRLNFFPFVKRFVVSKNDQTELKLKYVFTDLVEDGFSVRDIFTFVANTTNSQQKKYHFVYWWQGIHDGRDIFDKSFQQEALLRAKLRAEKGDAVKVD